MSKKGEAKRKDGQKKKKQKKRPSDCWERSKSSLASKKTKPTESLETDDSPAFANANHMII